MIHRQVNNALIEGNVSHDNRKAGIAIFDSHDAVVRDNTVTNNAEAAIRLSVGASRNLVEHNTLTGLSADGTGSGYVVYTYKGSDAPTLGGDGMPKDNVFRDNQIVGSKPSVVKIGDGVRNTLDGNAISGPAPQFELLRQSTGNVVRDAAVGTTFQFKLDSTSDITLQDSRGMIWQLPNSFATTAAPDGSTVTPRSADAGNPATATLLDLAVRPSGGSMAVTPLAWSAGQKRWSEQPSGATGAVSHMIGGLQSGASYRCWRTANRLEHSQPIVVDMPASRRRSTRRPRSRLCLPLLHLRMLRLTCSTGCRWHNRDGHANKHTTNKRHMTCQRIFRQKPPKSFK